MTDPEPTPAKKKRKPATPRSKPAVREILLTAEQVEHAAGYFRGRCTLAETALLMGVSKRSLTRWRERGRIEHDRIEENLKPLPKEAIYLDLYRKTQEARTRQKVRAVAVIVDLMANTQEPKIRLQAAIFYLERIHPDEWARRDRIPGNEPAGEDELAAMDERARREATAALDELEQRRSRKVG